ncbi:DUF2993 domain-containing protein [Haloechinothrix sp. YIM 98757]|uniref:DUF2993 domain-containing protein n=2 Tax=Haloechinothrix aidingensis TaxID=2752311 RepID=A0A838A5U2_9PSEU|nr:DUF2993 domain-containing protein [Haloechinothrix aidingensis]
MKKAVVVVIVLAALLVGADLALAAVAEDRLAQEAREQFELSEDPDVTIHGFPFTPQAVGGTYQRISIDAEGVPVTDVLRELDLAAELRDVHAPLPDVLRGDTDAIVISELEGTVTITQDDVGRALKLPELRIDDATDELTGEGETADDAGSGSDAYGSTAGVRLAATTDIAGERNVEVVAYGLIELTGESVRVGPRRLEFGTDSGTVEVPDEVRNAFLPQFETTIDPGNLPFGVTPSGVAVRRGALVVQGEASDVRFGQGA